MNRHKLLPENLSEAELAQFLAKHSPIKKERYNKRHFTHQEIADFEHESCLMGRTILDLNEILDRVKVAVTKGLNEELVITIPVNIGTKNAGEFRTQNDNFVRVGYEEVPEEIYGMPNREEQTIDFVTLEGELVESKPMSETEKVKFRIVPESGRFLSQMSIDDLIGSPEEPGTDPEPPADPEPQGPF